MAGMKRRLAAPVDDSARLEKAFDRLESELKLLCKFSSKQPGTVRFCELEMTSTLSKARGRARDLLGLY